jgi:hypothetical protein
MPRIHFRTLTPAAELRRRDEADLLIDACRLRGLAVRFEGDVARIVDHGRVLFTGTPQQALDHLQKQ